MGGLARTERELRIAFERSNAHEAYEADAGTLREGQSLFVDGNGGNGRVGDGYFLSMGAVRPLSNS